MAKYVADTNVLIDALRSATDRQAYERFLHHGLALTYVSAVVGMELLACARSGAHALASAAPPQLISRALCRAR